MNKLFKAHIAQIVGALIAGAVAWGTVRNQVSMLSSQIQMMQGQIRQLELSQAEQKGTMEGFRRARERDRNR